MNKQERIITGSWAILALWVLGLGYWIFSVVQLPSDPVDSSIASMLTKIDFEALQADVQLTQSSLSTTFDSAGLGKKDPFVKN